MCTLLIGRDVLKDTVIVAANRDEDPERPSDPPMRLSESPAVAGGRDRVALGTWLAVRERACVVALHNRRGHAPAGPLRSRGRLTLEVAAAPLDAPHPRDAALERAAGVADAPLERTLLLAALAQVRAHAFAPFTLVIAGRSACALLAWDGVAVRASAIPPGWHALTHTELDDPREPRAAWLASELAVFRPDSALHAERLLLARLADHGEAGTPPVCLHHGRMPTVSSSFVCLGAAGDRWLHVEGRPCTQPAVDVAGLLP